MALISSAELLWAGFAGLLLLAIVAGFIAGVAFAPAWYEWRLQRACKSLERLVETTLAQLERSARMCRQLGEFTGELLAPNQWSRLDGVVQQLHEAFRTLAEKHGPQSSSTSAAAEPMAFTVEWNRNSVDTVTGLPDRDSLNENLPLLLTATANGRQPSGVLLVSVDKAEQLRRRFGTEQAEMLETRLATLLIKAARDQDLVCRLGPETFAVLLPCVSPLTGARVAETLRTAVREHRFRASETGPEVMVTASFGFTACLPGDAPGLVLDRAGAALAKSQSCGRNQLHVHDADHHALCRVG